jgi:hypothetical protein
MGKGRKENRKERGDYLIPVRKIANTYSIIIPSSLKLCSTDLSSQSINIIIERQSSERKLITGQIGSNPAKNFLCLIPHRLIY